MKRTLTLLSGAAMALSLASAQPAHAVTPPNGAIQGTGAFGANILYLGDNQSVGTFTFDGNGGVTGVIDFNYFGTAICNGMTLSGTYVVNPGRLSGTAVMTLSSVSTGSCDNSWQRRNLIAGLLSWQQSKDYELRRNRRCRRSFLRDFLCSCRCCDALLATWR